MTTFEVAHANTCRLNEMVHLMQKLATVPDRGPVACFETNGPHVPHCSGGPWIRGILPADRKCFYFHDDDWWECFSRATIFVWC